MNNQRRPDLYTAEWHRLRAYVLERDKWVCHICGGKANSVDHIIPVSAGGSHSLENLSAACFLCNSRKKDKHTAKPVLTVHW